jgi:hypothetical protein
MSTYLVLVSGFSLNLLMKFSSDLEPFFPINFRHNSCDAPDLETSDNTET